MDFNTKKIDIIAESKEALNDYIDYLFIELMCMNPTKEWFKHQWQQIKGARKWYKQD